MRQRRPFTRRGQLELLVRHQTKWIVSALIRKRTLRLEAALREHEFAERRRWLTPERRLPIWRDVEVLVAIRRCDRHQRMAVGINEFDLRSILVAALGSVLLLLVLQAISGRGSRRRRRR